VPEVHAHLRDMIVEGNLDDIRGETQRALEAGFDAQSLVDEGLALGMQLVGQRFKSGDLFLPEVLRSAQAMDAALEVLGPCLSGTTRGGAETAVVGTVEGDIHSIGKDLVALMLQGAGFHVVNLGVDVKPAAFVQAIIDNRPSLLAMSALLTTTMPMLGETIEAVAQAGLRGQVVVLVGGAPVTAEYASAIGADGYARNAGGAVEKASELLGLSNTTR